ncbi:hypothetical protein SEA_FORZA_59 [Gordonia phage Forza]|uniref:Uncharacterized protein n=1 Tax=Gordonia phage Forza TaxID=2571247 RepID=A0A650FAX5_9CAUD|nr:hypothetical protein PP303_gp059 [Gordonia phage Forza]QEM41529.1 hypothetical protein SEA_BOOPY_60 [Gordonia phage Boopy]QGT55052.1 hypothetical protein SEA_FORZA_59 [Gordonia phage Forza]WBF03841.1 hypothetical protein SEA_MAREELIH_58 [Gordonia phage Mareelih]
MPKVNINGLEINLTVDELIEYQTKTALTVISSNVVPEIAPEIVTPKVKLTPPPLPRRDDEPAEQFEFRFNPDKDYTETRDRITAIQECGFRNATLVRAIVVSGHELDERIGACRDHSTEWLLQRKKHEIDLLNNFGTLSRQRMYTPYIEDERNTVPWALGVAYWYTMLEFGYNDMELMIAGTENPAVLDSIADLHTEIIRDYLNEHDAKAGKLRQRVSVDMPTRKKLAKGTIDLAFEKL